MRNESTKLDSDELMHLAMHAENHEQAIDYLKRVLEISEDNGKAYYLLGAIHAEIGMYDRATEEMTRAVELEPDLPTAHFQLGLLHVTSARVEEAEHAWRPLDKLGESDPLFLFKRGMLHLVKDEFNACIEDLSQGIALNSQNEALNNDMRKIISKVEQFQSLSNSSSEVNNEHSRSDGGHHILLSAYQRDDDTEH
ncbi:MAG: tetratricopeptide repeat protein [Candidatus Thiodiazotropha sp.]